MQKKRRHHLHHWGNRTFYAGALIALIMVIGTAGMHHFEKMDWVDAFYFMSMIATAQGTAITPTTDAGKIFATVMAFLSVGVVLTAIGFVVGPLMGKLFKVGFEKYDEDMEDK